MTNTSSFFSLLFISSFLVCLLIAISLSFVCSLEIHTKTKTVFTQPITHYQSTMVQAINNPDGTVSIIQMDPNSSQLITLPDGTQAQLRAVSAVRVSCIV